MNESLLASLEGLGQELQGTRLRLEVAGVGEARRTRDELVGQLGDYLLPRLRALDAPLLAVVGGSTGAGKSTLVNSLVGREVSAPGVLRPTTRAPVLVCHPHDEVWFRDGRILPALARTTGGVPASSGQLELVLSDTLPAGLALLDAPDIDSVVAENRVLAAQLLAAADLWLFVTTAARYADAVPWDFLRTARARSTAMAVILNRVPPEAAEVRSHLAAMLEDAGLGGVPLFTLPEVALGGGLLRSLTVEPVRYWLTSLVADASTRAAVVRTTLDGALDSLAQRVPLVAAAVEEQAAACAAFTADVDRAYTAAKESVAEGVSGGSLLRGEVLARWQEFVGAGDLMRGLEARVGWARDRLRSWVTGRPAPAAEVKVAVAGGIEALVLAAADRAAEQVAASWEAAPAGPPVDHRDLRALERSSPGLGDDSLDAVRAWQGHVLDLVAGQGASRRTTARFVSYSVNAVGVALMVAVFAHTGGLTGGEVVVAGGTATVSQKLLEAVFGDQAVRELAGQARTDLLRRVDALLDAEAERFRSRLVPLLPERGQAERLRETLRSVDHARQ